MGDTCPLRFKLSRPSKAGKESIPQKILLRDLRLRYFKFKKLARNNFVDEGTRRYVFIHLVSFFYTALLKSKRLANQIGVISPFFNSKVSNLKSLSKICSRYYSFPAFKVLKMHMVSPFWECKRTNPGPAVMVIILYNCIMVDGSLVHLPSFKWSGANGLKF